MLLTNIGASVICKTERILEELHSDLLDMRLFGIAAAVCVYAFVRYRAIGDITDIIRTREEQLAIYPDGRFSVHEFGRGLDIVFRGLGHAEHEEIRDWINERWPYGKTQYQTAKYHDAGTGDHLHLQVRAL